MAAPTTGHRQTDHIRTMHLCEVAADFALPVLKPGGHFLAKVFQGGTEGELLATLKRALRQRPPRQAAGEPGAVGGALPRREGISRVAPPPSSPGLSGHPRLFPRYRTTVVAELDVRGRRQDLGGRDKPGQAGG